MPGLGPLCCPRCSCAAAAQGAGGLQLREAGVSLASFPEQRVRLFDHQASGSRAARAGVEAGIVPGRGAASGGAGLGSPGLVFCSVSLSRPYMSSFSLPTPVCLSPHLHLCPWLCSIHCPQPACSWARTKENGLDRDPLHPEHLSKRPCTLNPAQRYSPSNGPPQPTPPHYRLEDIAMAHHFRDAYRHADPRELRERHRPLGEQRGGAEAWMRVTGAHMCPRVCT